MTTVRSFDPIARPNARVLILGSMPGKMSLARQQYYAHPRNLFWFIMGDLFGAGPELPYPQRLRLLQENGVALWDVLKECYRESALDSDIVETSILVNDFAGFLEGHGEIRHICFNGAKAEQAFRRYVLPNLPNADSIALTRLPSTSPANASIPDAIKLENWRSYLCSL